MPSSAATSAREILTGLHDIMSARGSAQVKLDKVVDLIADKMRSEVCSIYLLRDNALELSAKFAFCAMFYLLTILNPESFKGDQPDLLYFSFVTLATLGYGDIVPHTRIARSMAVIEALVGMLYIAVFMARLVSMRSNDIETE